MRSILSGVLALWGMVSAKRWTKVLQSFIRFFIYSRRQVKNVTTLTIRIEEELKKQAQEYAESEDLSLSQVVRKALKEYLKNNNKEV